MRPLMLTLLALVSCSDTDGGADNPCEEYVQAAKDCFEAAHLNFEDSGIPSDVCDDYSSADDALYDCWGYAWDSADCSDAYSLDELFDDLQEC